MRRCSLLSVRWPQTMSFPARHCVNRSRYYTPALAQKTSPNSWQEHSHHVTPQRPPRIQQENEDPNDTFGSFAPELMILRRNILTLLGSAHKGLSENADKFYFLHPSHQLRPLIVLLFAKATNGLGSGWAEAKWQAESERTVPGMSTELDGPLARPGVLNEHNPNMPDDRESFEHVFSLRESSQPRQTQSPPNSYASSLPAFGFFQETLPTQLRLAHIVEMINLASLLHDEVTTSTSLSSESSNPVIPTKLAVLGGDFLLGRASTALSRLGRSEVVELIASVISNIVEGRVARGEKLSMSFGQAWEYYMRKTYLESASLLAKGARAAVLLGGSKEGQVWNELAYSFGRNLGFAHQVSFSSFAR